MCDKFYLRDSRSNIGSCCSFWRDGGGYTSNIEEAEVFTKVRAQGQHEMRETDIPLFKPAVDSVAVSRVDMQYLPKPQNDENDQYLVQINNQYEGNDILLAGLIEGTFDYLDAKIFKRSEIVNFFGNEKYSIFAKSDLDKISRRILKVSDICARQMIKNAGIKIKPKKRQRPTTGKYRGNCPACGKITWDYNPHENSYCEQHKHSFLIYGVS